MCGIVGIWDYRGKVTESLLGEMRDTLEHRGPDDSGLFFDQGQHLGLGHRRLSIIDLSSAGHQPMERGDFVLTYNGEIYNFLEIKKELERQGVRFESNSDTEVLIQSFARWGEDSVHRFRGMFAFAIWDKQNKKLTLCRDRAGVKPLYYYFDGDKFIFASGIKAIMKHPGVRKELNFDALAIFLQSGYIPSPLSIFKKIYKLEPGHFLVVNKEGIMEKRKYWDIADFVRKKVIFDQNEEDIVNETEDILEEAFKLRMVSDVPVGVFLSGGIDSSLVAALLKKNSNHVISTFTIGFEEDRFDEAKDARKIAQHLGTDHHELYLTQDKALDIISRLPEFYDEPFGGASAIPTFLVSEFARGKVKVALSADGGDELFAGYGQKYPMIAGMYEKYSNLPDILGFMARIVVGVATPTLTERFTRLQLLACKNNLADTYSILSRRAFFDTEIFRLIKPEVSKDYAGPYKTYFEEMNDLKPITQVQLFDFKVNLADNILTKVDRASMAVGLESREPFLDPLVMQHAASLPMSLKRKNDEDKYLLKKILYKYVPKELMDRPKHGFSMPIEKLLRNGSRNLIEEYLNEKRISKEGILNQERVAIEKAMFLSGEKGATGVWRLVVFQMWRERWLV